MKKTLRDYLPILMMLLCAAGFGALLLTGVIDLNTVPQLVEHRPVLAVLVILALFIAKGFSGVVVYNALVVVVSLIRRCRQPWPSAAWAQRCVCPFPIGWGGPPAPTAWRAC